MAKARALDKRRKSIRNIRKITRTMELIATARYKRAADRASAGAAYTRRITKLVADLARAGLEVSHPLLEPRAEQRRAALLVLTANRGLCGGYNAAVLRRAYVHLEQMRQEYPEVRLEVSGKRGLGAMRFRGLRVDQAYTHFEDRPSYEEVELLANRYLEAYETGQLDHLDIVYTRFDSIASQQAVVETLLPLSELAGTEQAGGEQTGAVQYEFLPSAESILEEIVPASFRVKLFKCFLDAAVSEQIARMVAMKAATENAQTIIGSLSRAYNRARQTSITGEILEILSGAEALKG